MQQSFALPDILIILLAAITVIVIFRKINLSPVIGYIVAGALIGPYGLELTGYNTQTKAIAEFGIVFLLFAIGLELTLERLISMHRLIFGVGLLQFFVTAFVIGEAIYLLTGEAYISIIIGTSLALSSTAIVLKIIYEQKQSNTSIGNNCLSILLFQDLIVIPLFVLIPLLAQENIDFVSTGTSILFKSIAALAIIIIFGRFFLRPALHVTLSSKYNDVFIAATLFIILSAAWITQAFGLSLALGAFFAGVIIAETEFRHQIKPTILQFKGLFLGFFFVTEIGMHFDLSLAMDKIWLILAFAFLLIIFKSLITFLICLLFKIRVSTAINTALLVSQGGEFAFVLFELATKENILSSEMFQTLSLIVGVSMAVTPLLAILGNYLSKKIDGDADGRINKTPKIKDHVVIAGFGRAGQTIAEVLDTENINYSAIDLDQKVVNKFFKAKKPIYLGDITKASLLSELHIENARAVILTLSDVPALNKSFNLLTKKYPNVPIIVRAHNQKHHEYLKSHGAKNIVTEIYELGLRMSKELLMMTGASELKTNQIITAIRQKNNEL